MATTVKQILEELLGVEQPERHMYQLAAPDTPTPEGEYVDDIPFESVGDDECQELAHAAYAAAASIIGNIRVTVIPGEEIIEWRLRGSGRDDWKVLEREDESAVDEIHGELCLNRYGNPHDPWLRSFLCEVWSDVVRWIEQHHHQAPIHVVGWCWILPVLDYQDTIRYVRASSEDGIEGIEAGGSRSSNGAGVDAPVVPERPDVAW